MRDVVIRVNGRARAVCLAGSWQGLVRWAAAPVGEVGGRAVKEDRADVGEALVR